MKRDDMLNHTQPTGARQHTMRGSNSLMRRRGVTLVELLIVIALVILLAGISLPSIKAVMKDQRTTQSARLVQGFLESARARAIALNRPVAAILERQGTDQADTVNLLTCTRMSIGEVFPPYEGDWSSATGTLVDTDSDGLSDQIQIPAAQAATLTSLVTAGDAIEIGDRKFLFTITSNPSVSGTNVLVNFQNPIRFTATNKSGSSQIYVKEEGHWPTKAGTTNITFRIYRKPSKTMALGTVLPKGTCIDLEWSGFGSTGTELATTTAGVPTRRSIFIVFNPRGTVDSIYEFQQALSGGATSLASVASNIGLLHLLIGRTEQVGSSALGQVSARDTDFVSNVFDTSNRWVSLNTLNGLIYSSDVGPASGGTLATSRVLATNHLSSKD